VHHEGFFKGHVSFVCYLGFKYLNCLLKATPLKIILIYIKCKYFCTTKNEITKVLLRQHEKKLRALRYVIFAVHVYQLCVHNLLWPCELNNEQSV